MSRATPDDQLKFLLSCVKYSNNGKIDFIEVAHECGVVSKGAAFVMSPKPVIPSADVKLRAKRYERLMKSNGINPNGGPDPKIMPSNPSRVRKNSAGPRASNPPAKRRKVPHAAAGKKLEGSTPAIPKPEPLDNSRVDRPAFRAMNDFPVPTTQGHHAEPMQMQMQNEESMLDFNEFCTPEMFANCTTETQQPSSEEVTPPVSGLYTVPVHINHTEKSQEPLQPVEERLRLEEQPERETMIIAD